MQCKENTLYNSCWVYRHPHGMVDMDWLRQIILYTPNKLCFNEDIIANLLFFQQITQNQCNSQDLFAHKPCRVAYELPASLKPHLSMNDVTTRLNVGRLLGRLVSKFRASSKLIKANWHEPNIWEKYSLPLDPKAMKNEGFRPQKYGCYNP